MAAASLFFRILNFLSLSFPAQVLTDITPPSESFHDYHKLPLRYKRMYTISLCLSSLVKEADGANEQSYHNQHYAFYGST
jgi:hypothetical protein